MTAPNTMFRSPPAPLPIRPSRLFRSAHLLPAAGLLLILVSIAAEVSAGPRIDPRLNSLRVFLSGEKAAGRTPRMLSLLNVDGSLLPGTRTVTGTSGPSLIFDCIMELDDGGRDELARNGIEVRSPGRFVTAGLTAEQLDVVATLSHVRAIEMARLLKPSLDVSADVIHATEVHGNVTHDFPPSAATGRNVIVGLVDTGLDIKHDDFRNADGTTRVKWIWDQTNNSAPHPVEFGRGTEWSESQINAALANGTTVENDVSGHGTHVAGIAAGDGSATGNGQPQFQYVGIAPQADIIAVKTTFLTNDVLDAIDYIFARAASAGHDAVINLSLGTQDGPHDGTSIFDQAIGSRLGPGKIVTAAAGNESAQGIHARLTMAPAADSVVFTFAIPGYTAAAGAENDLVYIDGWYDGSDNYSFIVEAPSGWRSREVLNNQSMTGCSTLPGGEGRVYSENNFLQGNPSPMNGDKEIYIEVTDRSNTCGNPSPGTWKIIARRKAAVVNGIIDFWVAGAQLGAGNAYPRFVQGASNDYLVGSPASAPGVLSVGAFITKRTWPTPSGNRAYQGVSDADIGRIASFSSPGPLRNGAVAPALVAPGMGIASSKSSASPADPDHTLPDEKHLINQGTSQASPHLAGSVALVLERWPHQSPAELFDRFTRTTIQDRFTGAVPNNLYGYGKLNVLAAINFETPFAQIGTTSSPGLVRIFWTVSDSAPPFTGFYVSRADQPGGPYVRITPDLLTGGPSFEFVDTNVVPGKQYWYKVELQSPGGAVQSFGPFAGRAGVFSLSLSQNQPNPFKTSTTISFRLAASAPVTLRVFDLNGRLVRVLLNAVPKEAGSDLNIEWDGTDLQGRRAPSGIYFYQLKAGAQKLTKKMLLVR